MKEKVSITKYELNSLTEPHCDNLCVYSITKIAKLATSVIFSSNKIQNGDILVPGVTQVHLENGR